MQRPDNQTVTTSNDNTLLQAGNFVPERQRSQASPKRFIGNGQQREVALVRDRDQLSVVSANGSVRLELLGETEPDLVASPCLRTRMNV